MGRCGFDLCTSEAAKDQISRRLKCVLVTWIDWPIRYISAFLHQHQSTQNVAGLKANFCQRQFGTRTVNSMINNYITFYDFFVNIYLRWLKISSVGAGYMISSGIVYKITFIDFYVHCFLHLLSSCFFCLCRRGHLARKAGSIGQKISSIRKLCVKNQKD